MNRGLPGFKGKGRSFTVPVVLVAVHSNETDQLVRVVSDVFRIGCGWLLHKYVIHL
jgi:hypothetical protein